MRDDHHRADDGVGHAATCLADGLGHLGEERQAERRDALRDDVEQHEGQGHQRHENGQRAQADDDVRQRLAKAIAHDQAVAFATAGAAGTSRGLR